MSDDWKPPFCAHHAEGLVCPHCGEESVRAREKDTYFDADAVEAYCAGCHAELEVYVSVEVTFSDVELIEAPAQGAAGGVGETKR